ncbi:hemerythrin [Anaerobacterium chartisolvens]|uniref:Hemerythrin n=1 Tax=Anaerobacterium chartisolvens TaxID=1297424 RepID=A0A369AJN3_9FIRM|nr:bacteriohemerythrin [Anaerobacterium chartisolvens]RCX09619.1 hemerythrin [Anaerobacterium chartisolvens]
MFEWKANYSCNIEEIDNQHKKLFEIAARLYDLASLKDEYDHYDEIVAIINELEEYTVYHFAYEEKLMLESNYKDYETHKIEHDFFIKKIKRLEKMDMEEDQSNSVMKMIEFVADWISAHILKVDINYKEHFNSRGIV